MKNSTCNNNKYALFLIYIKKYSIKIQYMCAIDAYKIRKNKLNQLKKIIINTCNN